MRKTKEEETDIDYEGEEISEDKTLYEDTPLNSLSSEKKYNDVNDVPIPNIKKEYLWTVADVLRDFYKANIERFFVEHVLEAAKQMYKEVSINDIAVCLNYYAQLGHINMKILYYPKYPKKEQEIIVDTLLALPEGFNLSYCYPIFFFPGNKEKKEEPKTKRGGKKNE